MFVADSNYETDHRLGRGLRKKKPVHLDSESSDEESEPNSNVNLKRRKTMKKLDTCTSKKYKSATAMKAPPSVPLCLRPKLTSPETNYINDKIILSKVSMNIDRPEIFLPHEKFHNRDARAH